MSYERYRRLSPYADEDEIEEEIRARRQRIRRLRRRRQLRQLYRRYEQRQLYQRYQQRRRALVEAVEEQRRSEQEVLAQDPITNLVSAFLPYLPPGSIETPTWIGISSSTATGTSSFSPTTTYTSPLSLITETRSKFTYTTGKKNSRKKRRNLVGGPNDPEETRESTTRPTTTTTTWTWSGTSTISVPTTTQSSASSSSTVTTTTTSAVPTTSAGPHSTTIGGGVSPGQGSGSDANGGSQSSENKPSPGVIVGSVVGSVLGAAILVALLLWLCKVRRRKNEKAATKPGPHTRNVPNMVEWNSQDTFAPSPRPGAMNQQPGISQTRNSRRWGYTPRPGCRGYTPRISSRNSGAASLRPSFMEQIQNRRSPLGYAPVQQPPEGAGSIHSSSDSGEVYHTTDWIMGGERHRDSDMDSGVLGLGLHRSSESTSSSISSSSSSSVQGRSLTRTLKPLPPIPPPILPPIPVSPPIPTPIVPLKSPRRQQKMPAGISSSSNPNRNGFLSPRNVGNVGSQSNYQSNRFDLDAARWREENDQYGGQDDLVSRISSDGSGHSIKSPMTVSSIGDWDLGTGPPPGMSYSYWGHQNTPRR